MSVNLKPCPFCGGEAIKEKLHKEWHRVICGNCGVCRAAPKLKRAITDWNTRWNHRPACADEPKKSIGQQLADIIVDDCKPAKPDAGEFDKEREVLATELHKIYEPNDASCSYKDKDWFAAKFILDKFQAQALQKGGEAKT